MSCSAQGTPALPYVHPTSVSGRKHSFFKVKDDRKNASIHFKHNHSRLIIMSWSSLLNYVPHAPSRLICFCAYAPYVPYVSSCFTRLYALRALLTHLIYALCAPFSHALFVGAKIPLRWICSPAKTFLFSRTIKGTTNGAVFMRVKISETF